MEANSFESKHAVIFRTTPRKILWKYFSIKEQFRKEIEASIFICD